MNSTEHCAEQFVIFLMLIVVILIVTEITIRIADYYSTPCDFTKSPLFDELSTFEKWEMCRDYSSINMLMNYKYYIDEPINLNNPNQNSDYFNIDRVILPFYSIYIDLNPSFEDFNQVNHTFNLT